MVARPNRKDEAPLVKVESTWRGKLVGDMALTYEI